MDDLFLYLFSAMLAVLGPHLSTQVRGKGLADELWGMIMFDIMSLSADKLIFWNRGAVQRFIIIFYFFIRRLLEVFEQVEITICIIGFIIVRITITFIWWLIMDGLNIFYIFACHVKGQGVIFVSSKLNLFRRLNLMMFTMKVATI